MAHSFSGLATSAEGMTRDKAQGASAKGMRSLNLAIEYSVHNTKVQSFKDLILYTWFQSLGLILGLIYLEESRSLVKCSVFSLVVVILDGVCLFVKTTKGLLTYSGVVVNIYLLTVA